jgi:transposase
MAKRQFQLTDQEVHRIRQAEQQTREVHELKRLQAVRLYGTGMTMRSILNLVPCGESSVRQWAQKYTRDGLEGLKSHWQGGNANKLTPQQRAEIKARLHDYRPGDVLPADVRISEGAFWTVSDLRIAVRRWYGVTYKRDDSYRQLFHACGFSYQRAERRYRSRPDAQTVSDFEAQLEKK